MTSASTQQQLDQTYGTTGTATGPGGVSIGTVQRPASQGGGLSAPPQPGVQLGLSPGERAQRTPTIDNNIFLPDGKTPNPNYGQPISVPLSSVTPGEAGPAPVQPPPSPANPPRLNQPAAPAGTLATGLPPGTAGAMDASAKQYADDTAASGDYQRRIFPLAQASALLKSGDVTTGPGAEAVANIRSFLETRASSFGWDLQSVHSAKFQELNKYLTQYVNSQSMAAGSDARLASALSGNPSAHLSTLANKDVVSALVGLERMKQMAITDFASRGLPANQYAAFLRTWQTQHDPRAFIMDQLNDDQRKKMVAGMSEGERRAFGRTLDLLQQNPDVMNTAPLPH